MLRSRYHLLYSSKDFVQHILLGPIEGDRRWIESDHHACVDVRLVENNYVRAALNYRMTEVISLNTDFAFDLNTERGPGAEDSYYYRISPYVSWRITDSMYLRLLGEYGNIRIERDGQKRTSERYRTWMSFDWHWPRLITN